VELGSGRPFDGEPSELITIKSERRRREKDDRG
jgi:hypothetical protein